MSMAGNGPGEPGRPVYVYQAARDGADQHLVAVVEPALVRERGLVPEVILGAVTAGAGAKPTITPEAFTQNRAFVMFLEALVRDHIGQVDGIRREAQRLGDGHVYLVDGRTPDPGGTVPPQDVIGAVEARNGVPLDGTYQHNPNHRLLTGDGFFVLPPSCRRCCGRRSGGGTGCHRTRPPDRLTEVCDGGT